MGLGLWEHKPVIPAIQRLREEGLDFEVNLDYMARLSQKKKANLWDYLQELQLVLDS
jgi:hypothetical protein